LGVDNIVDKVSVKAFALRLVV